MSSGCWDVFVMRLPWQIEDGLMQEAEAELFLLVVVFAW